MHALSAPPPEGHGFHGNVDGLLLIAQALAKRGIGELLVWAEGEGRAQLGAQEGGMDGLELVEEGREVRSQFPLGCPAAGHEGVPAGRGTGCVRHDGSGKNRLK